MRNTTKNTALITGASSGIGKEFAHIFARKGYDIVLVARNGEKLSAIKTEIEKKYRIAAIIIVADLSDVEAAEDLFKKVKTLGININVLINNAGFGMLTLFKDQDIQECLQMIRLNIISLTLLTKLFLPDMLKRNEGRILNVASTAAFQPGPLMSVYYATKAYVLNLSEALNMELKETGVHVSTLCPGSTRTQFQNRAGIKRKVYLEKLNAMNASEVAEIGFKGLMNNKPLIIPGLINKFNIQMLRILSREFVKKIIYRFQSKR